MKRAKISIYFFYNACCTDSHGQAPVHSCVALRPGFGVTKFLKNGPCKLVPLDGKLGGYAQGRIKSGNSYDILSKI